MNRRVLKIVGWLVALALVLGVGAVAGGGIVYAMTRANESIRLVSAEQLDPNPEPGIVIASVAPDGPAAEAGVVRGDILLQVDDEAVDNLAELMRALRAYEPGDEVALTVLHGDDERTLTATLGDRDGQPYLGLVPCAGLPRSGHRVTVHTAGPGATIIGVEPNSPADLAGLQAGDVIVAVDGQELGSENNLADVIATYEPGDTVTLKVKQPGEDTRDVKKGWPIWGCDIGLSCLSTCWRVRLCLLIGDPAGRFSPESFPSTLSLAANWTARSSRARLSGAWRRTALPPQQACTGVT